MYEVTRTYWAPALCCQLKRWSLMPIPLPRPTEAELEILRVLWDQGPSTVRGIHTEIQRTRTTAYTTVLKLLQIMTDKGLVTRDESGRSHVYRPRVAERVTQRQLVTDLLRRAFRGSATSLVLQALDASRATPDELDEIRRLIDRRRGARS
jgi:BlaI family transcriptional regulator, penicillinase repressor